MSEADFDELHALIDTIHNQPITRLEKFAKLSYETIRRGGWNVQAVTYTEFWDWLQEYEEKLGRGVVMVMGDQLGYLRAEHILPYARQDMAQDILTYQGFSKVSKLPRCKV